jgi:hypothetical protein
LKIIWQNTIWYNWRDKKWTEILKQVKRNEKDAKVGIVRANSQYGVYRPRTVCMFREMSDMEARSFDKVDVQKVNRQIEVENKFNFDWDNLRVHRGEQRDKP